MISANHLTRERTGRGVLQMMAGTEEQRTVQNRSGTVGRKEKTKDKGAVFGATFGLPTEKTQKFHVQSRVENQALVERVRAAEQHRNDYREEQVAIRSQSSILSSLWSSDWGLGADGKVRAGSACPHPSQSPSSTQPSGAGRTDADEAEARNTGVVGMARKIWMGDETEGWKEQRMREEREALEEGRGYGSLIMEQIWEVWNWDKRRNEDGELVPKEQVHSKM